jgi:hypothetical protein
MICVTRHNAAAQSWHQSQGGQPNAGHSHVSVTLGICSPVIPRMQQQAAEAIDLALGQYRSRESKNDELA